MPEGGSNAGLGIEAGLGFGGGSRFGVGFGLGLGTRRFQALNPHQGSGLPKGLVEGTRDGAGQDPFLAATVTHVVSPAFEDVSGFLSGAAAGPGKRHGELPGSLPSQPATLQDPRSLCCQTLELGPHEGRALARVRVRSRDVARAEATPVS